MRNSLMRHFKSKSDSVGESYHGINLSAHRHNKPNASKNEESPVILPPKKYTDWDVTDAVLWLQEIMNISNNGRDSYSVQLYQYCVMSYQQAFLENVIDGHAIKWLLHPEGAYLLEEIFPSCNHRAHFINKAKELIRTEYFYPSFVKEKIMAITQQKGYEDDLMYDVRMSKTSIRFSSQQQIFKHLTCDLLKEIDEIIEEEAAHKNSMLLLLQEIGHLDAESIPERKIRIKIAVLDDMPHYYDAEKKFSIFGYFKNVFNRKENSDNGDTAPGQYHVALVIDQWMLDWRDSSLCVPRKFVSNGEDFIQCDLTEITVSSRTQIVEIYENIADTIARWNNTKTFARSSDTTNQRADSQDFVEDVCKALDLNFQELIPPCSALGMYIDKIRKEGCCDIEFPISESFKLNIIPKLDRAFINKIDQGRLWKFLKFDSHQELCRFVHNACLADKNFLSSASGKLLRAFDDVFHLKFSRDCSHECRPRSQAYQECPFLKSDIFGHTL